MNLKIEAHPVDWSPKTPNRPSSPSESSASTSSPPSQLAGGPPQTKGSPPATESAEMPRFRRATLEGRLGDVAISDLLQFLALSRRTGRIDITRRDERAVIVVREGRLLFAATGSPKETLGHMLLARNLVAPDDLEAALQHHRVTPQGHLGSILVERGLLSGESLEDLISEQIEEVLAEILLWPSGRFAFTPLRLESQGEIEVDPERLSLDAGVAADQILLRLSGRSDEAQRERPHDPEDDLLPLRDTTLREIIDEIRSPMFTSEMTSRLLAHARRRADRGVMFAARIGGFGAIGQFGLEGPGRPEPLATLQGLRLPLDTPSILAEAAEQQRPYRAFLPETDDDRRLLTALGGGAREGAALPLVLDGRVLLVLYLENREGRPPMPALDDLELLMLEAGRQMENDLLRKRLGRQNLPLRAS